MWMLRGMVKWCRENAALSGLGEAPIRYIADDCCASCAGGEARPPLRRGHHGSPTYGHGSTGEMWRLEDHLWELLTECRALLTDTHSFPGQRLHGAPVADSRRQPAQPPVEGRSGLDHRRRGGPAGAPRRNVLPAESTAGGRRRPENPDEPSMPSLNETYYERAGTLLAKAWASNAHTIAALAPVIGQSLASGGVVHTFGSGHSELISRRS